MAGEQLKGHELLEAGIAVMIAFFALLRQKHYHNYPDRISAFSNSCFAKITEASEEIEGVQIRLTYILGEPLRYFGFAALEGKIRPQIWPEEIEMALALQNLALTNQKPFANNELFCKKSLLTTEHSV